jgi:hypothetical protein
MEFSLVFYERKFYRNAIQNQNSLFAPLLLHGSPFRDIEDG